MVQMTSQRGPNTFQRNASTAISSLQNLIFKSKARGVVPCEPSPSGYLISKDLDKYGVANLL
jgi:hypothetical protein